MRKKLSKIISVGIICAMVVLMFVACGSEETTEDGSEPSADDTAADTTSTEESGNEPVEFSYMLPTKFANWLNDLAWYPELKKRTNVEIELIPGGEDTSSVDLRIAGGDLPDAVIATQPQAELYGSQGAFVDLKPLIDQYAPSIKKCLDDDSVLRQLITTEDGKIYGLPQGHPGMIADVIFYREDMFKEAGITEVPRTIEELTEAFTKLKDTYSTTPNFYPFTGRDDLTLTKMNFVAAFGAEWNIDANGKLHGILEGVRGYDIYSEGYKELIQWYRDLYAQGLIDPEWVTGTATEDSWQTKMLVGNGAVSCDFVTRPGWFMMNGGPENDPDYSMKPMPPLLGKDGKQTKLPPRHPKYMLDRMFAINAKSEKVADIVKFVDYIYSDEGMDLLSYGIEGVHYKIENGKKVGIVDVAAEIAKPVGTINYGMYQDRLTFPRPANDEAYYEMVDPTTKSFGLDYLKNYTKTDVPQLKYSKDQLEERSNLLSKIKDAVNSYNVKFIRGDLPMSEWNNFLNDVERMGYKRVVEIDQEAYDALYKK